MQAFYVNDDPPVYTCVQSPDIGTNNDKYPHYQSCQMAGLLHLNRTSNITLGFPQWFQQSSTWIKLDSSYWGVIRLTMLAGHVEDHLYSGEYDEHLDSIP